MVEITSSTILITGADGGIGSALVNQCLQSGAKKVYATGLNIENLNTLFSGIDRVTTVELDVTKIDQIERCATLCSDTNIVINNAAVECKTPFIGATSSQTALFEMKVNYIGLIDMINAFVPHLQNHQHSAIVNILSMGALAIVHRLGTYCASKTAAHVLTESIRGQLAEKNITVMAAYMGYVNTNMVTEETASVKSTPEAIAVGICNGINNNEPHIFPDAITQEFVRKNPIQTAYFD